MATTKQADDYSVSDAEKTKPSESSDVPTDNITTPCEKSPRSIESVSGSGIHKTDTKSPSTGPIESFGGPRDIVTETDTAAEGGPPVINTLLNVKIQRSTSISIKLPEDRGRPIIDACCFMPGGELVLCDSHNDGKIKLLDNSLTLQSVKTFGCRSVAAVDANNVIVVRSRELQLLQIFPSFKERKVFATDKTSKEFKDFEYNHVAASVDEIYASCSFGWYGDNVGQVRVYNMKGKLQRRIGADYYNMLTIFKKPTYIAVSNTEDKIVVTDAGRPMLICLTKTGQVLSYIESGSLLKSPAGLCLDEENNIILCDSDSEARVNVRVFRCRGKEYTYHKRLIERRQLVSYGAQPLSVAFRPTGGMLVIGYLWCDKLSVYYVS